LNDDLVSQERADAELEDDCVPVKGGVGWWFVEQDKASAVPYHGFGIFF